VLCAVCTITCQWPDKETLLDEFYRGYIPILLKQLDQRPSGA